MKSLVAILLSSVLIFSCSSNEKNEQLERELKRGSIKAYNGKYFSFGADRIIFSNKDSAETKDVFVFNWIEKNRFSIVSYDDYLLSTNLGMDGEVTATRKEKREGEIFTIELLKNNFITIQAYNGKYFTVDSNSYRITASSEKITEKEKFKFIKVH